MFVAILQRQRPFATALVPRLSFQFSSSPQLATRRQQRLPGDFENPRLPHRANAFWPLHLQKKSSSSDVRQASLVVHGPEDTLRNFPKQTPPFHLIVVESPSKCATIFKILQQYVKEKGLDYDFVVTSCLGHVRNLRKQPIKGEDVAGIDLKTGYKTSYSILPEKENLVYELKRWVDKANNLVLATDDDREGEAMAWHLLQVLDEPDFVRMRFGEITPKAIVDALEQAQPQLRDPLVQAQETRRILDRLAGFTVSPVLWRKIAPGLSAGRVQSVGMALIVQRERERLLFQESEYWDAKVQCSSEDGSFEGNLVAINDQPVANKGEDFEQHSADQLTKAARHKRHWKEADARELQKRLESDTWTWKVEEVNSRQRKLNPAAPFITSTLQQESNKRLGLSVSATMSAAQQLYERGFISYMRTDSNHLSKDAQEAVRSEIVREFGDDFFREEATKPKRKKGKNNAAHEAIRPAIQANGGFEKPEGLPGNFDQVLRELYTLIYQRTVGSHMPPQVSNSTSVRIVGENEDGDLKLTAQASGSVVVDPGFTLVYANRDETSSKLPKLEEAQDIVCEKVLPIQHFSQPPSRYYEASFVKELESLGVGRPSTYAGTVKILRDRAYVGSPNENASRSGKAAVGPAISAQRAAGGETFTGSLSARGPMVPSLSAFVVCSLLEEHCNMYVDPSFTAKMEERLDRIAHSDKVSEEERIAYLDEFYSGEEGLAAKIKHIDEDVDSEEARRVNLPSLAWNETSGLEEIGLFVGPWGPYVKRVVRDENRDIVSDPSDKTPSASLPSSMSSDISSISLESVSKLLRMKEENGVFLGHHPKDGREIRLKVGRFGAFLQWGQDDKEGTTTHTLPPELRNAKAIGANETGGDEHTLGVTYEDAVKYVGLPRTVASIDDKPIVAAIGPYGPYLKYTNRYHSLKPEQGNVITIDAEAAKALVTEFIIEGKRRKYPRPLYSKKTMFRTNLVLRHAIRIGWCPC